MDVRCEKCNTEYELDDAKVTEAGVTVKCTSCGNLFKVRRRQSTNTGAPPTAGGTNKGLPPARPVRAPTLPPPVPQDAAAKQAASSAGGWMLRHEGSPVQRFRELTTLQQWIVERKVSRDHEISRTGESWKRLGDIAELAAFFMVVDQADAAAKVAGETQMRRRNTQPFVPPGQAPAGTPSAEMRAQAGSTLPIAVAPPPARPRPLTPSPPPSPPTAPRAASASVSPPTPPTPTPRPLPTPPAALLPGPAAGPGPSVLGGVPAGALTTLRGHDGSAPNPMPRPAPPMSTPPPLPPGAHDGPSGGGTVRPPTDSGEPSGPTGGMKGAPVLDPSWAGSADAVRRSRAQMETEAGDAQGIGPSLLAGKPIPPQLQMPEVFEPTDIDDELPVTSSRWPWLALGLFVVILGGGAAVYFLLFQKQPEPPTSAALATPDAAVVAELTPDAATASVPPPAAAASLAEGWTRYWAGSDADLEAAEKLFEAARAADPAAAAEALAGLSLVNAALAQGLADDADDVSVADARRADQLRAEARRRVERAATFAKESLARGATTDGALAQAEARRLAKAPIAEVDKILAGAEGTKGRPDAAYAKGMVRLGFGKVDDARKFLQIAAADHRANQGGEHVRARLALARLALAQKKWDDARREVGAVLAVAPDHVRAKALADQIAAESGSPLVAGAGGMPDADPTVAVGPGPEPSPSPGPGTGPDTPPPGQVGADAYDTLVAKGNARAENGDCKTAMLFFEKALDARPGGVEALVGLGYCHMDRKEFARAQANFRAALGISPRFGDALIGLAEAYRFQGQHPQAIEFYQRYLDSHPGGAKAEMARRQIKALAGGDAPPTPPADPPPGDPPPGDPPADPPPKPPADPATPPEGTTVPDESGDAP